MEKTQHRSTVLLSAAIILSAGNFAQADLWGDMKSAAQSTVNDAMREMKRDSHSEPSPASVDNNQAKSQPSTSPVTDTKKASFGASESKDITVADTPSATSANASEIDIISLRIGMTKDEAMKAIAAHSKDMRVVTTEDVLGGPAGVKIPDSERLTQIYASRAVHMKSRETIIIDYPYPPNPEAAIFISRTDEYFGDGQLALETVRSAVIRKYGKPTSTVSNGLSDRMVWTFDESGQQLFSEDIGKKCEFTYARPTGVKSTAVKGHRSNFYNLPGQKGCGVALTVKMDRPIINGPMLRALTVTLFDHEEVLKARKATKSYVADLKQKADKSKLENAQKKGGPVL